MSSRLGKFALAAAAAVSMMGAASAHADGALYESFAGDELVGLSLSNSSQATGFYNGNATNVTVGGGSVYFENGVDIYRANPDLTGVALWHQNGIAPTDIAVDAANNTLYESFAGDELVGLSLSNSSQATGFYNGNATNVTVGGGFVYFQSGVDIYRANPDLTSVALWHQNGIAPTDIAVDAANNTLYESFAGDELVGLSLSNSSQATGFYNGNATNVTVGGGYVYFQDGVDIYRANPDLTGVTLWHQNGIAPTDIALYIAPTPPAVPEPATWALMLLGVGSIGAALRRRGRDAGAAARPAQAVAAA